MHSFNVYIDEAGDEGFDFSKRTPEWFIISAVITRQENDLDVLSRIIKETREQFKYSGKQEIHFRKLTHEKKIAYLSSIASSRIRSVTVAIHKPSLREQETFHQKNKLYFYACRLLLERVTWFCRDNFISSKHYGDGTAKIVFSKRKNMSYAELKDYLNLLYINSNYRDIRINWSTLRSNQIVALGASQSMGLQVADAVASSCYSAVNKSDYGYVEDKYMRIVKPTIYRHGKIIWGYGFKVFPEGRENHHSGKLFEWING